MAFIRNCVFTAVLLFCYSIAKAQVIYYPVSSSKLLKSTAQDVATLLQNAITGSQFTVKESATANNAGITFIYDSSITDNQACRVQSDGRTYIKFTAAQDNGLNYGVYQYLHQAGFRFYQPGTIWQIVPTLTTAYKAIDTIYTCAFKYREWVASGGIAAWAMDNTNAYTWDAYGGENGHNLALYQRRNGTTGAYRFSGHRADVMTGDYLATLKNNPCYVANYNNSRVATSQSVPDVNNAAAMQLWASVLQNKYLAYKSQVYNNKVLHADLYLNFLYTYQNLGIEVPDGARWGNTKDNSSCTNNGYSKESDQQFILANNTARKIGILTPNMRFQVYAYSAHADVPSAAIDIDKSIDVQLIPAVYQNVTSTNGLRNRWYNRTKNISEYNYLNLPSWSGETPAFDLKDLKATLQIAKDNKSQGLMWESGASKFATLPYLLAANNFLVNNITVDSTLKEFCNNMFAAAAKTVYDLLQLWADKNILAGGTANRYKVPLYLHLLTTAIQQTQNATPGVQERLRELKAYLHYMILYYNWTSDQRSADEKADKAAALCIYLAKTNKMQLVNSYYLISVITGKYATSSSFYQQYNKVNGLAYKNGQLPLITSQEIDNDFVSDNAQYANVMDAYKFETSAGIKDQFAGAKLAPIKKIAVKLYYTNGMDFYNRAEYFIKAPAAGNFIIQYTPTFDLPDNGYVNFTVESTDKALSVLKDFTIDRSATAGSLTITLPSAGTYKLTVSSKYKTKVDLEITTNGNYFYKDGPFIGVKTELYNDKAMQPGYFYIPAGIKKIYFTIANSYTAGIGFASAEKISSAFVIKDNNGNIVVPRFATPKDSSLFYIEIPASANEKFWQVTGINSYNLVFANISNLLWYTEASTATASCANLKFTIGIDNVNGNCITRLRTTSDTTNLVWQVTDQGHTYTYNAVTTVSLPDYISPNAVVLLKKGDCSVSKQLSSDADYLRAKENCASGAVLPASTNLGMAVAVSPVLYPNPSTGNFNCMQNGAMFTADRVNITNLQGQLVNSFINVKQFDISRLAAGIYYYRLESKGAAFSGKISKL